MAIARAAERSEPKMVPPSGDPTATDITARSWIRRPAARRAGGADHADRLCLDKVGDRRHPDRHFCRVRLFRPSGDGRLRRTETARAVAYVTTTLVGAALVVLGTLCLRQCLPGGRRYARRRLCIQFAGVFGGYNRRRADGVTACLRTRRISAGATSAIGGRLTGWLLAGGFRCGRSLSLAALRTDHYAPRGGRRLPCPGPLIAAERRGPVHPDPRRAHQSATDAVIAARRSFTATPKRPAGRPAVTGPSSNCSTNLSVSWPLHRPT